MYTEYKFGGKKYQFNTSASFKMGKVAFIAKHPGVPNVETVWNMIEANSAGETKAPKDKSEKAPSKK